MNRHIIIQLILAQLLISVAFGKSQKLLRKKVDQSVKLTSTMSIATEEIQQKLQNANDQLQQASLGKIEAEKSLFIALQEQTEASSHWMKADEEFQAAVSDALNASQIQLQMYDNLFNTINKKKKKRTKLQAQMDSIALESAKAASNAWQNLAVSNLNLQEAQRHLNATKIECDFAQIELYASYGGLANLLQKGQLQEQDQSKQLVGIAQQNYLNLQQQYYQSILNLQKAQKELVEASNLAIQKQKEADISAEKANGLQDSSKDQKSKQKSKKKFRKQKL